MLAIILAVLLALIVYFSEPLLAKHIKHHKQITSFGAGVSVSYLFMQLLPEFTSKVWLHSRLLFVSGV